MADENEQNTNVTLRDLMNEIRQQRIEVQNLREEVQGNSESVSCEVKKLKKAKDIVWKYNGNKVQFEFNEDLEDTVGQLIWSINNSKLDYSKELCEDLQKKLKRRNKLIRLADSSSGGWDTVKHYESNPIASDSEDETKIQKAESRALKRKRESSKGRSGVGRGGSSRFPWGSSATSGSNFGSPAGRNSFRGFSGGSGLFNGISGGFVGTVGNSFRQVGGKGSVSGPCFACGEIGHIRRYCPRVQKTAGTAGFQFGGKPE